MDPSGYCHRKLGGAQTLLLPRFDLTLCALRFSLPILVSPPSNGLTTSLFSFAYQLQAFAPSKPHRSLRSVPPDQGFPSLSFDIQASAFTFPRFRFRFSQTLFGFRPAFSFASQSLTSARSRSLPVLTVLLLPTDYSLLPLFPRSSPRPISIIKLHTLPHFHR